MHYAVYFGNIDNVKLLLSLGANWRIEAEWHIDDESIVVDPDVYTGFVNALELAASLGDRESVALILKHAKLKTDDKLVQDAYNAACNFKRSNVLYSFLTYKNIKHSHQAILNAIEDKDLCLFEELKNRGASICSSKVSDTSVLNLALDVAMNRKDEGSFSLHFQTMLLSIVHHDRLIKGRGSVNSLHFDDEALMVIEEAMIEPLPEWIHNLISYLKRLPTLLDKQSELTPVMVTNVRNIQEIIAKYACAAVKEHDASRLDACLSADESCLAYPGRYNPLHQSLQNESNNFVREAFVNYILRTYASPSLSNKDKKNLKSQAGKMFESLAQYSLDQYDRTFAYRLDRSQYLSRLHDELEASSSFFKSLKLRTQMLGFNLNEARIYCFDRFYEKTKHNSKIQSTAISQYGYPLVHGVRSLGALASDGPLRYGLGMAWYYVVPNYIKKHIMQGIGKAGAFIGPYVWSDAQTGELYAPILADNVASFLLMPQYYAISTVVSNGIYYLFKDTGYDNCEALFQLAGDSIAIAALNGTGSNYEIDERYSYHLSKNLTPFLGEWGASYAVPIISNIDLLSNKLNAVINYPVAELNTYFSANFLSRVTEAIGAPSITLEHIPFSDQLRAMGNYIEKGFEYIQSLHRHKRLLEEQAFNFIEEAALQQMRESTFKNDRLHAIQVFEVNRYANNIAELKTEIEDLKKQSENEKLDLQKAQENLQLLMKQADASDEELRNQQAVVEAAQKQYDSSVMKVINSEKIFGEQKTLFTEASEKEEILFKKTEGFSYYETWQERHVALMYGMVDEGVSSDQLNTLKKEEAEALEKSKFFNSASTNKTAQLWAKSIDELFDKYRSNFLNSTNIINGIENIVNVGFDNYSDRNKLAQFLANEIIRFKYPFYPDIGDAQAIEAERQLYEQEISNHELQGYIRQRDRAMDRVYDYIFAKLTNSEKKPHIHRFDRIMKPFVNEIFGKTIGWVPFKDFKGGRSEAGNVGLQYTRVTGGSNNVSVTAANVPIFAVYDSSKKRNKKPNSLNNKLISSTAVETATADQALEDVDLHQAEEVKSNYALDVNNPIILEILAEQYEKMFDAVSKINVDFEDLTQSINNASKKTKNTKKSNPIVQPGPQTSKPITKGPAKNFGPVKSAPKTTPPKLPVSKEQSWWDMAYRAVKGEKSAEVLAWQRKNINLTPKWIVDFVKGVDESTIPVAELPEIFGGALNEAVVELVDGTISLSKFAASEVMHHIRGEQLQTTKAISLLAIFIGEEAARITLKEQTDTSRYVRELAAKFDSLDKKERVKALSKIYLTIKLPQLGIGLAKKTGGALINGASKVTELPKPKRGPQNKVLVEQPKLKKVPPKRISKEAIEKTARAQSLAVSTKTLTPQFQRLTRAGAQSSNYSIPVKARFLKEYNYYEIGMREAGELNIRAKAAETFLGGRYKSYVLEEDIFLYRVGELDGQMGSYFTYNKPYSELSARINNAILPVWPEKGGASIVDTAFRVKIPSGTQIHVGLTAPQGEIFLGGNQQIYIESAWKIPGLKVVESYPLPEELIWNPKAKKLRR